MKEWLTKLKLNEKKKQELDRKLFPVSRNYKGFFKNFYHSFVVLPSSPLAEQIGLKLKEFSSTPVLIKLEMRSSLSWAKDNN